MNLLVCEDRQIKTKNKNIMENILRTKINICDLEQGMTVEHNGKLVTVSRNNIKFNELFGYSFRGDGSSQTVTRMQFIVKTVFGDDIR